VRPAAAINILVKAGARVRGKSPAAVQDLQGRDRDRGLVLINIRAKTVGAGRAEWDRKTPVE
jgi:hypothetical protein